MSILKSLLHGRPNGLRARLFGKPAPSSSAPRAPEASFETGEKALGLRKEAPKDVTPPDGFEVVLHKDALPDGQIIEVIMGGTSVAVARVDGVHYAIANTCAHAGGPLGDGKLAGSTVTCPYHGWKYDVTTGRCLTDTSASVKTFPVRIVGDAVCVQL